VGDWLSAGRFAQDEGLHLPPGDPAVAPIGDAVSGFDLFGMRILVVHARGGALKHVARLVAPTKLPHRHCTKQCRRDRRRRLLRVVGPPVRGPPQLFLGPLVIAGPVQCDSTYFMMPTDPRVACTAWCRAVARRPHLPGIPSLDM